MENCGQPNCSEHVLLGKIADYLETHSPTSSDIYFYGISAAKLFTVRAERGFPDTYTSKRVIVLWTLISWVTNNSLILAENFSVNFICEIAKFHGNIWREISRYNKQAKHPMLVK